MTLRALLLALPMLAAAAAPAGAVVNPRFLEPADGAVVSSRPLFVFDGEGRGGSVDGEVAKDPTLLTAGDRAGAFVEPLGSFIEFFGDDPSLPENAVRWDSERLTR